MRRIIPINNFVIARKMEVTEEVTSSGLIIPVTKAPSEVVDYPVHCASKDCKYVKDNDTVVFPARTGTQFEIDGTEFIAVDERNIMCKIENE